MSPRRKKGSRRYVGYLLVLVLYLGWFQLGLNTGALALLSGLTVLYALFIAPMPCCAINRNGTFCRNNAYGLLMGCWYYQHRWQTALMLVRKQSWARLGSKMFRSIAGNAATLTALAGMVSVIAALAVPFITKGLGG